jgi:hypothetical protein
MLLDLASAVFLGSESLGTRDHILLSQTRDFSFRRLLRLAGSRWGYSTPPPHGHEETSLLTLLNWILLYNHFARTKQKTQTLYCWECVFTAPLCSNGSYPIVACVFVAAWMCLPSTCLTMDVSYDFIIPAFGRHITILNLTNSTIQLLVIWFWRKWVMMAVYSTWRKTFFATCERNLFYTSLCILEWRSDDATSAFNETL